MDIRTGSEGAGEDRVHALIDVTQVPLAEFLTSEETVFEAAVRRVLEELDQSEEIIAGFASYP